MQNDLFEPPQGNAAARPAGAGQMAPGEKPALDVAGPRALGGAPPAMKRSTSIAPARFDATPKHRPRRHHVWAGHAATHVSAAIAGACLLALLLPRPANHASAIIPDPLRTPPDRYSWSHQPDPLFPIPPYARFLQGVKIVIDPGHVGQIDKGGGWKRGPTGLREAEVNLRVAGFLREFLDAAGADVTMTRERDMSLGKPDEVDLADRAALANSLAADLLLSIHHNAAEDPGSNYTTVYFHKSPDDSPASVCAARYLLTGIDEALRLEQHTGCALRSDYTIYPRQGFAVLRQARVPAVLCESSFHSNPSEEQRLRDAVYNRREAYGLFLGLARWAQAGLPRVKLLTPEVSDERLLPTPAGALRRAGSRGRAILVNIDDGFCGRTGVCEDARIARDSLRVEWDGNPVKYSLDLTKRMLSVDVPHAADGRPHELFVDFENLFGQHVLHPALQVR